MESYLNLFEQVIRQQAETVGSEAAYAQARRAGLKVSREGRVVNCAANPQLALLRLMRHFTEGGNVASLMACRPLIDEILRLFPAEQPEEV